MLNDNFQIGDLKSFTLYKTPFMKWIKPSNDLSFPLSKKNTTFSHKYSIDYNKYKQYTFKRP